MTAMDSKDRTERMTATVFSAAAVEEGAYEYLVHTIKLPSAVACGILANIACESGFILNAMKAGENFTFDNTGISYTFGVDNGNYSRNLFCNDGISYGLFSFRTPSLKAGLYDFALHSGKSIASLSVQMDYLNQILISKGLLSSLREIPATAEGAYEAGFYFCVHLERPLNMINAAKERGILAQTTYWPKYSLSYRTKSPSEDERR